MDERKMDRELSIPLQIILEILKELPVKSLLRFRCVSKLWCSTIDDPIFIDTHQTRSHTRPHGTNTLALVSDSQFDQNTSYDLYSADPEGGPATHLLALPEVLEMNRWTTIHLKLESC
ncbi:putative F-box protein At5g62060 isoform X2 [Cornus florida]|uniref:putative F-box protein At5g62060 isoform X2 n=1 Tax=Cornus florida TaxID=4283 RepID=UPI0028A14069|nr:putative F-box protein At5g62060 isoform X2 [Cornus florida]